MLQTGSEVALLLVDITGSTKLYDTVGDEAAFVQIGGCLARLAAIAEQQNGSIILSRGDDLLCSFAQAGDAFQAVRRMLAEYTDELTLHGGLHYGPVVLMNGDIYGDAANVTARLSSHARPGEALVSSECVAQLSEEDQKHVQHLGDFWFKGKASDMDVFSLVIDDPVADEDRTKLPERRLKRKDHSDQPLSLAVITLKSSDQTLSLKGDMRVTIGRSSECDMVLEPSWVSRQHAIITTARGKVEIEDISSSGTYVQTGDGYDLFLRREKVVLAGAGLISPTLPTSEENARVVRYFLSSAPQADDEA